MFSTSGSSVYCALQRPKDGKYHGLKKELVMYDEESQNICYTITHKMVMCLALQIAKQLNIFLIDFKASRRLVLRIMEGNILYKEPWILQTTLFLPKSHNSSSIKVYC